MRLLLEGLVVLGLALAALHLGGCESTERIEPAISKIASEGELSLD